MKFSLTSNDLYIAGSQKWKSLEDVKKKKLTGTGIEAEFDPLVFDGQRGEIALTIVRLSAVDQQTIFDLTRFDADRHLHP